MTAAAHSKLNISQQTHEKYYEELITVMMMTPQDNPAIDGCRWGQPAMFWGGSGIGKSDHTRQAAMLAGMPYEVIYPGTRQPEDFSGVTVPANTPEGIAILCMLPAVRKLNKLGRGLLHIDEATGAPPAVQGAMLSMLLERIVGDTPLAPEVCIMLSGNPPEISSGGFGFTPPIANRLAHFRLGPPNWDDWNHWYMLEEQPIEPLPIYNKQQVIQAWPTIYPRAKGAVSGFLYSKQGHLYEQPAARDPKGGFQWPSPRTWVKAGRCLATRQILNLPAELDEILVTGLIGEGIAAEFLEWRKKADLPTPEQVLDGQWRPDPTRLDTTYAVVGSIVPYIGMKQDQARYAVAMKAWQFFDRLIDVHMGDMIVESMKMLVNNYGLGISGNAPQEIKRAADTVMSRITKTDLAKTI
jgi:hypothetical protein